MFSLKGRLIVSLPIWANRWLFSTHIWTLGCPAVALERSVCRVASGPSRLNHRATEKSLKEEGNSAAGTVMGASVIRSALSTVAKRSDVMDGWPLRGVSVIPEPMEEVRLPLSKLNRATAPSVG